ncbi:hypothetical protein [Fibrobacter sp.]|uniref:hypothetical protein n=1 Tax=Fibrobacter sp. TaxID=35828 RepID=UPI00388F0115
MRKLIFATVIFGLMLAACGSDDGATKSCVRKAYCVKSTEQENMECDLDPEVTKAKMDKYKEAGTFEDAHEECWDF